MGTDMRYKLTLFLRMAKSRVQVGRGRWVVARGSWVAREYCDLRILTLKSPHVIFE